MTAQIHDTFEFAATEFALVGISAGELFSPAVFDLQPAMATTACWRGYQARYAVVENALVLRSLHVNLLKDRRQGYEPAVGPVIRDVSPQPKGDKFDFFNNHYHDIDYPVAYSGGLLIAQGFIRNLYVHMGFHPAWKYDKVMELIFADGVLLDSFDRSAKMAAIRARYQDQANKNPGTEPPTVAEIDAFIKRAFDQSY